MELRFVRGVHVGLGRGRGRAAYSRGFDEGSMTTPRSQSASLLFDAVTRFRPDKE